MSRSRKLTATRVIPGVLAGLTETLNGLTKWAAPRSRGRPRCGW